MKKQIDNKDKEYILSVLIKSGITNIVLEEAKKMNLSLEDLFYNNIILSHGKKNDEIIIASLLGIYGNCYAAYYFNKLGYEVSNEKPVYDKDGNLITVADISFIDENKIENYCEVKTAFQIIDNMRNYYDPDKNSLKGKCYVDRDDEIIKYKNIGKKLLKQVGKLSLDKSKKVNVIVFSGCYVDDIIKEELKNMNVSLITLSPNINDLYGYMSEVILFVKKELIKYYTSDIHNKKLV